MSYTRPRPAGPVPPRQARYDFPERCPRCFAAPGDPCQTRAGRFSTAVHIGRVVTERREATS